MAFQVLSSFVLLLIAITLVTLSIIFLHITPTFVRERIHEALKLKQNSQTENLWKNIKTPIYNRFYFFNVTNGDAIQREGAKPVVVEVGPFTYHVQLRKTIVRYNSNGTISYRERKTWIFARDLSLYDEDASLFTLNTPLALTLTLMQRASASSVRVLITLALDAATEGFFIKRTVRQLLFEGYPDVLTTFGPMINPEVPSSGGYFAYMYGRNNSDDGLFNVFSGVEEISKLNFIDNYNKENSLKLWSTDYCNSLENATNGQLRPPLKNETIVKLFSPDICRILRFRYQKSFENRYGLQVRRYVLDSNTFRNHRDYPPNFCYLGEYSFPLKNINTSPDVQRLPYPSGIMDLSKCRGTPVFVSQPHFLNGAKFYRRSISGLSPNVWDHDSWIDIDPLTGITMNLSARLQVNIAINKLPGMIRYRFVPEIVFPVFWQEYTFEITAEMSARIANASFISEKVSIISFYTMSLGILLIIISLCIYLIPTAAKTYSVEISAKSHPSLVHF